MAAEGPWVLLLRRRETTKPSSGERLRRGHGLGGGGGARAAAGARSRLIDSLPRVLSYVLQRLSGRKPHYERMWCNLPLHSCSLQGYCAVWYEKCVWFLKTGLYLSAAFSSASSSFPAPSKLSVTFPNNYVVAAVINYSLNFTYLCFFFLNLWLSKGTSAPLCEEGKQTCLKNKQLIPN